MGSNERLYNPCYYSGRVPVRPGDFSLQSGYRLEPVVTGLTYPTSVTFDNTGNIYVGEAGYSYGPAKADGQGRILAVSPGGRVKEVARGFRGPMTSIRWHKGYFYVAEGAFPGRIFRVTQDGRKDELVRGLRSGGDHFTTEIVFGPDKMMYFGVGTFTNSAVIGIDNFFYGWLPDLPNQHDVPCRDIVLRGVNFKSIDPFALAEGEVKIIETGAFKPFGTTSYPGEVIKGELYCNGVIYRCAPDGSGLAPFADGFRNPFGLGFSPAGRFYAIDQGYDARGSRPVTNSLDPMWEVTPGGWYGWPDFVGGEPITNPKFSPQGKPPHQFVLKYHPPLAGKPVLQFAHHSATMKFDFSTNPYFGYPNQAFAAQFGSAAPITGHPHGTPGFKVVRVNPLNGQVHDFLVNNNPGPEGTGPARPVDVKFDPRGENLYIVDFGVMEANRGAIIPWSRTGSLWKVARV